MPLIILTETPTSPVAFVDFWAPRYHDPHESLYTDNIRSKRTTESLQRLFKWKIGDWLFAHSLPEIEKHFISRHDEASKLPPDTPPEIFLQQFSEGGAIWRIFWLHCWNQRFPIYDQHVHRAMTFIEAGKGEELDHYSDSAKITAYLTRYLPFVSQFKAQDGRAADRALWAFGKFIKAWWPAPSNLP